MQKKQKLILAVGGAVFGLALLLYSFSAPTSSTEKADVSIEMGWGSGRIARHLEEQGVVRSAFAFRLAARLKGASGMLKAGDYALPKDLNAFEVAELLVSGKSLLHRFLIREGLASSQVAALLEEKKLASAAKFKALMTDKALLKQHGIDAPSFEGYLFPDSYQIARGIPEATILAMMVKRYKEMVPEALLQKGRAFNLKPRQLLTLASLVEKEAKSDLERPKVARVFLNRRRQKKRLESCATIRYALDKWKGPVLFKDLEVDSPYNTYRRYDLPPGPICSPGLKSILAAGAPAEGKWLFFVVAGDGNHVFSENFEDHKKAKTRYKKLKSGVVED